MPQIHLEHYALGVPDLKVGEKFYSAFGLNMRQRANHLAFGCDGHADDQIVLIETGRDRRFHHLSFGADVDTMAQISRRLEAKAIKQLDPPYKGAPDGLWFSDSDRNLVNVHLAEVSAHPREEPAMVNSPGNVVRRGVRGCPQGLAARPRRLGHMILFTPNVLRQAAFYGDILGMLVTDTIQTDYALFMRTPGSSDHHVLGLLGSESVGFHHGSFEMASIDETEIGAKRLFEGGYRHAWGPGRHGVGSNYFHYFRDPWNGLHEYFCDIDFIPDNYAWHTRDWTKKEGMFLWSADGPPPADFGQNFEAI